MEGISESTLIDIQEKFEKAQRLVKERDPQTEPYRSKYAAASILMDLKSSLIDILESLDEKDEEQTKRFTVMLGAVWLNLGTISLDTEALSTSAEELQHAVSLLRSNPLDPSFVIVLMSSLNQLGVLYSTLCQPENSKSNLEQSEKVYLDFVAQEPVQEAINIEDLFRADSSQLVPSHSKADSELEKTHTLTLYYLAQIYGTLEDYLKSAVYCHNTLKRQLEHKDYDPVDWALNSATLSQFFMERNGFKQARHHLAAASYILEKYDDDHLKSLDATEEVIEAKKEEYNHRSADVARCWAKYGLLLLGASKDRLMARTGDDGDDESPTTDLSTQKLPEKSATSSDDISGLLFATLEIPTYENQITDKFVLDYDDALPVFHTTKQWLEEAKRYYTLEEHASDYVRIIQDSSALYQALAFFEGDEQRQCCMHKRRVDQLEEVLSALNHQCYLLLCRQLWFELGETYWEMLHLKLSIIRASGGDPTAPDPHVLNKLNTLTQRSIANFGHFLESIPGLGPSRGGKALDPELVRPVLTSHFYRGRLFARVITPHKSVQIENNEKSLESFKFIVDYCANDPEAAKLMALELSVCKEMVELIPYKISRLSSQLENVSLT